MRLQVQLLTEQRTDHDIRASLQELPRSIDATYIRSLDHIYHLDDKRRKRVQRVFRWLICAGSPGLNVELVRHAIAVDEMSDHWDLSMVVTNHNGLISDCANLVEFTAIPHSKDKSVPTIQFIHTSVKDFLVNPSSGNSDEMQPSPHLSRFFIFHSLALAHHIIFSRVSSPYPYLKGGPKGLIYALSYQNMSGVLDSCYICAMVMSKETQLSIARQGVTGLIVIHCRPSSPITVI